MGYATPAEQQKGSAILVLANDAHSWPMNSILKNWVGSSWTSPLKRSLDEMGEGPDMEMLDALEELAQS